MSSNKTEHFKLHSWHPDDQFHVAEINENFDKLDSAVPQEMEKVKQALTKEIQDLDSRKIQIIAGRYMGWGRVELGVKPLAVISMIAHGNMSSTTVWSGIAAQDIPLGTALVLDESGFTPDNDGGNYLGLYYQSRPWHYIVFY